MKLKMGNTYIIIHVHKYTYIYIYIYIYIYKELTIQEHSGII